MLTFHYTVHKITQGETVKDPKGMSIVLSSPVS